LILSPFFFMDGHFYNEGESVFGTIVNTCAIIVGSLIGLLFRSGIRVQYRETIMQAISLAVILIGLNGATKSDHILLLIFSLAVGSFFGEWMRIEDRLESVGRWFELNLSKAGSGIAGGFVTASLVFCVGSMAIVGSLESGLAGNHQTLYAKSMLDGISSIIFASSLGVGVMLSSISVFAYQGLLTITASLMSRFLTPAVINEMSAVGGLLIMAIGINLLEIKALKVGNMLPAIFIPLVYFGVKQLIG
jgi:uncharacterized protein